MTFNKLLYLELVSNRVSNRVNEALDEDHV